MNSPSDTQSISDMLTDIFFKIFPHESILSWLFFVALALLVLYLYRLPQRIHDTAIKKLEKKIDKENDLLALIRSQVEPQKIDSYSEIIETHSRLISIAFADPQELSIEKREAQINQNASHFILLSRFFLFASDNTIQKYIIIRKNFPPPDETTPKANQSFILYANLIVSMRQDLYKETKLDSTHLISIFGIKR